MNYQKALKSAHACIRHLKKHLESERVSHKSIEAYHVVKIAEMRKALRLYKEDNRERSELIEANEAKRKHIDAIQSTVTAQRDALLALEERSNKWERRANTAESVQELANIKIEQLQGHRIWLAVAVGMFIAKDTALYFGLL